MLANAGVAMMLYRFRSGDSNMQSAWVCSRNDAIGNLAVMAAALAMLQTMPPRTITMATGPEGGAYHEVGKRYQGPRR